MKNTKKTTVKLEVKKTAPKTAMKTKGAPSKQSPVMQKKSPTKMKSC